MLPQPMSAVMPRLTKFADGITVSNGLGWSPDGGTMYWSDTKAHRIQAFDFDLDTGDGGTAMRAVRSPI